MNPTPGEPAARVSFEDLVRKKRFKEPIVMVTAYDYGSARAAESSGVDMVLIGDSAATTVLGLSTTRDVTLDEMLMLTRAVRRGLIRPLLVGDIPFGCYEDSNELALASARRFIDAGCDAVKMEGAGPILDRARALVAAGIPVMGHVGLKPQSLGPDDPPRVVGRSAESAEWLLRDARELEQAGCFSIVFEAVPARVTERFMALLGVPIIGIGAGPHTDGQVLVAYDLLGLTEHRLPRFAKRYAQLKEIMTSAMQHFADDVRARRFPDDEHTYSIDPTQLAALDAYLARIDLPPKGR
jgi:3-methyl-2-oxobutanoate hydroxymethyltransferase